MGRNNSYVSIFALKRFVYMVIKKYPSIFSSFFTPMGKLETSSICGVTKASPSCQGEMVSPSEAFHMKASNRVEFRQ
jgi:hypothetical protein